MVAGHTSLPWLDLTPWVMGRGLWEAAVAHRHPAASDPFDQRFNIFMHQAKAQVGTSAFQPNPSRWPDDNNRLWTRPILEIGRFQFMAEQNLGRAGFSFWAEFVLFSRPDCFRFLVGLVSLYCAKIQLNKSLIKFVFHVFLFWITG
jgi:hypothetical protein